MAAPTTTRERSASTSAEPSILEDVGEVEPPNRPGRLRRLLRAVLLAIAVVAALGLLATTVLVGYLAYLVRSVEVPGVPRLAETTVLYDRNGERLGLLHGSQDRRIVPLRRISEHLREAVLAVEDKGFYRHGAIDPGAVERAAFVNVAAGSVVEGGSTITQQYVKNAYTGGARTLGRKIREAALAIRLEEELSKDEILERYLNTIFFGHGAYGAEAAAQTFFATSARRLSVAQAATLAGLIAAPTRFDPIRHPSRAERRRDYVLGEMAEAGFLGARRAQRLARRPLGLEPGDRRPLVPYFTGYVRGFLEERYGRRRALAGGLRVETTIDLRWQRAAERAVTRHLPDPDGPQAALVAIDPRTGEIRAMVGGRDFARSRFNLATQARRQPGSAFKPFVLAAALREGISPLSMRSGPASLTFDDPRCLTDGEPWDMGNYGDASAGTMTIAQGLANSVNTIYAQLALEVGLERVADVAAAMGIDAPLRPVCSIALGTQEVTPLEMTEAYATIAARGIHREPTPVRVVRDAHGDVVDRPVDREGARVLSRNDAETLIWALQGVVEGGTGTAAALPGRPVAGKTGTAQDYTNAWFCGFVRQLVTCVWVGHPEGNVPMEGVYGVAGVTGGSIPASIWHDFMTVVTDGMRIRGFPEPALDAYAPPSYEPPVGVVLPPGPDPDGRGDEGRDEDARGEGHGNGHDDDGPGHGHGNGNGNGHGDGEG